MLPFFYSAFHLGRTIFWCLFIIKLPTQNLIVENTSYLNDDYVLELAGVKDYPSFYFVSAGDIEKKLEESIYIRKAEVRREFFHVFVFDIEENKPLFINNTSQTVVFF